MPMKNIRLQLYGVKKCTIPYLKLCHRAASFDRTRRRPYGTVKISFAGIKTFTVRGRGDRWVTHPTHSPPPPHRTATSPKPQYQPPLPLQNAVRGPATTTTGAGINRTGVHSLFGSGCARTPFAFDNVGRR